MDSYKTETYETYKDPVIQFYLPIDYNKYGELTGYINNVSVTAMPTCRSLKSLTVTEKTRTTVTAQWNKKDGVANCTGYEIVISSNEDPEGIGIETKNITDVNTTSCTFEGLTRNTEYYIHAHANCGNGDYGEWKTITAKTDDLPADCSNTEEKTLTVGSSDIQYLPWGDFYNSYYTQQIYTAAELTNLGLQAGYIGKVAFQYALSYEYTKTVTIYMGTTADASFSSSAAFFPVTQCSQPVSTTFNTQNKWYEFELSTPFYWDGTSNIVVGMMAMGTNYPNSGTATFKGGTTKNCMSAYSRNDYSTPDMINANSITQNRANIKFTICPMAQACPAVTKLKVETDKEDITKATITWTASTGDYANTSEIYVSKNKLTEEELSTLTGTTVEKPATGTTFSYTAENLDEYTDYYVYVRCNCYLDENHDDGNSAWEMVHFKSLASCLPLNGIAVNPTSRTEATVTCTLEETATANLSYYLSETEIADDEIITPTDENIETSVFTIDGLTAGHTYYLYVANDCSLDGTKMSPYIHTSFTMPAAYPTVSDGSITGIGKYGFTVNWTNNDYLEGDTYEMLVTESEEQPESSTEATYTGITGTSHEVTGRNRDTHYIIYMRGCTECDWVYVAEATTLGLTTCEDAEAIAEGTSNNQFMPVMGDYCDSEQKVQMIYPSSMLEDIQGKTINAMKFFVCEGSSSYAVGGAGSWENIDFEVRMAMTERTELVNSWDETPSTLVYTGHLRANQTEGMTINFDNGFKYTGGNLLIETKVPESHSECWSSCAFFGKYISADNMARTWNSYNYKTSTNNFLPKVQFSVCETAEACPTVTVNKVEDLDYQSATITWTEGTGDFTTSYDLVIAEDGEMTQDALDEYTDKIENISETFQEVTGLSDDHDYYAYVRVNCNNGTYNDGYSKWSEPRYFHTAMLPCPQPTNIIAEQAEDAKTTAVISWTNPAEDPVHNYSYVLSTAEVDPEDEDATTATTPGVEITNLTTDITYYFYVKNDCGDIDGESKWAETTFTLPSMPAVTDIQIDNITYNTFNVSWTQSALGDETEWLVECTAEGDDNPTFSKVVNTNECYIFGLSSSTKYSVNVYPFESTTSTRGAVATKEEKTLSFNECYVVADSWEISENTPSTWYLPFTNYSYAYSQIIYDQNSLGGKSGKIVSIKLKRFTGFYDIADRKVFIGKTNKSSFESDNDWIAESDLTEIFSGTIQSGNDDFEIELATPFEYDGTGSIVLAFSRNNNSWETQSFYHTSTNAYSVLRRFDDNDPSYASHPEENSGVLGNERTNVEFCFETELTCGVPVLNLSHSNATENSVEVTWLPGGTERSWDVACLTEEMTEQSVFTIGTVTDIEWSTDTLSQGTHYYVYVRPACDKDADWEAKTEFTTCGTIGNYMICENNGIMEATLMKVEDSDLTAVDYDISYGTGEEEYLSYNYQFTIPYYIEGCNNNYFEVTAVDKHAFDELSSIDNIRIIAGDYSNVEFGEITAENIIYGTMKEINKGENQYTVSQPYKVNANDPGIVIVTRPYPYTIPQQPLEITCENGTEELTVSEDGTFHKPMGAKWDYGNVSFTSVEPITSNMLKVHLNEPTIINATRLFNARVAKDANAEVGDVDFTNCDSLTFQIDVINRAYPNYDFTSVTLDKNTKVKVEMKLDNKEYYYFALPFGCDIDDIKVVDNYGNTIPRSASVQDAADSKDLDKNVNKGIHHYVLLTWDESRYNSTTTSGYVALDGNATELKANKGYAILIMESYNSWDADPNVTVDATATFTAKSNYYVMVSTSESVDITTTRKDFMNTFSGWNLVGNPYYSTIQGSWYSYNQYASKIGFDRGGTDVSVTDYKPDVPVFNVDIKPFETLFVQQDDGAGKGTLTVGNPTLQNAQQAPAVLPEYITITLNDNERMMDRTTIINNDMASDGYMPKEDLISDHANSNEIYTTYYDIDFSFNKMNIEEGKKVIPVGVKVANEGDYTIALSEELTNYGIGNVVLHDKTLNKFTTLSDGEEETLHLGKGRTDGRLELIITVNETITAGEDIDDNGKVEVFVNNGIATINGAETGAIVMITDATGKTIYTTEATGDRIDYEFAVRGVYMITVRGEKVSTMKVVY